MKTGRILELSRLVVLPLLGGCVASPKAATPVVRMAELEIEPAHLEAYQAAV